MGTIQLLWNEYRYFPYEHEFAKREVEAITGISPTQIKGGLEIDIDIDDSTLCSLDRLTYFREIVLPDSNRMIPDQTRLEIASWNDTGDHQQNSDNFRRRQSTRYSAHGLHEYRGKFNPQIVRAIGNILRLPIGAWLLDPFCGSGTTLLESTHIGWNTIGIDMNPLGVLISNAKIRALKTPPRQLRDTARYLSERLSEAINGVKYDNIWDEQEIQRISGPRWEDTIPNIEYLKLWFPNPVLAQFAVIIKQINSCVECSLIPIFYVVLSDLVRAVSFQDPRDLRIRRRKDPKSNYPVITMFLKALERGLAHILNAQAVINLPSCRQEAYLSDSRLPLHWIYEIPGTPKHQGFDAAITSPPYATALPYIDTQRLSLCILGLIGSEEIMKLDREMIGTREILESKRKVLEASIANGDTVGMPQSVINLCQLMLDLAGSRINGFRRRNMPALIYSYFFEMAQVLRNVHGVLRQSGVFALVVGRNRTLLGDHHILIDTPQLLVDIASLNGWMIRDIIELNAYHRFDVHQRNSIRSECLVLLQKY